MTTKIYSSYLANANINEYIAIASANAMPKSIAGSILPDASGFLPRASIALAPINPIANAGPIPPIAIIKPPETLNSINYSPPLPRSAGLRLLNFVVRHC